MKDNKQEQLSFETFIKNYKENPNQFKSGIFYTTPDDSKIESLYEDEYIVFGLIVESSKKSQIGHSNIFLYRELIKL